ncbi:MAG: HD domain-containing phosphohydrolase [Rubrivivax sp.]|nr:HD domain-containing phosphohydrolase [Rubrivivax sp.]
MQVTALSVVKQRIQVGVPLPFNVRNADKTLLLARGQTVGSQAQLDALFERGALVDMAELQTAAEQALQAPRDQLPRLWSQNMVRVGMALQDAPHEGFTGALDDAAKPVLSLIERDPDLAIFQVLRHEGGAQMAYGARRSVHTAITAYLVAQRLGWEASDMERVFKVALTSNISMLALQGQLSKQTTAPTREQLADLQSHPLRSVQMLALAGVKDPDWLGAVASHHEREDGSGYPSGCTDVSDIASLVRRADVYTSKLASRSQRDALAADQAGRQMFMEDPGHPMTAALVKEFGIYPPGCHVRLKNGALAIVVQRGPTVATPIVACLTNERGVPLPAPVRIETNSASHGVAAIVAERSVNVSITADKLMALVAR